MKKNLSFLLLFLVFSIFIKAQEKDPKSKSKEDCEFDMDNPTVITLDFATKKITSTKKLCMIKRGEFYQFQIKNYNPFLYKVNFEKGDSVIRSNSVPPLFDIFRTDGLSALVATLKEIVPAATPGAPVPDDDDKSVKTVKKPKLPKESEAEKKEIEKQKTEAEKIIKQAKEKVDMFFLTILTLKNHIEEYKFNLEKIALKAQLLDVSKNNGNNCIDSFQCDTIIARAKRIIKYKKDIIVEANDSLAKYLLNTAELRTVITQDKKLKLSDSLIVDFYSKKIKDFSSDFDTTFGFSILTKILPRLINITSSTFEYLSLPMQATEDITTLAIKIDPWKSEGPAQSYSTKIIFPLKRNTFWGFSSGFYVSGLSNHVYSNDRIIRGVDTSFRLIKEKTGGMSAGVNALLHYGWLGKDEDFGGHIAIGPGLSIAKNPSVRMMIGGGLVWGRKDKMMLTVGIIMGQVERLASAYENNEYTSPQSGYSIQSNKVSGFISLTYSFLGSK